MTDIVLAWIQLIVGFAAFWFIVWGLSKRIKEPYLLAAIVAGLILTWVDSGGLAAISEKGLSQWLRLFLINGFWYFFIYFVAVFIILTQFKKDS